MSQDIEQDIEAKVREKIAEWYPKKKADLLTLAEEVARRHHVCGCTERDSRRVIIVFLAFAYRRELEGKPVAV